MKRTAMQIQPSVRLEDLDDAALAALVGEGDAAAVRLLTMRNNQRPQPGCTW